MAVLQNAAPPNYAIGYIDFLNHSEKQGNTQYGYGPCKADGTDIDHLVPGGLVHLGFLLCFFTDVFTELWNFSDL